MTKSRFNYATSRGLGPARCGAAIDHIVDMMWLFVDYSHRQAKDDSPWHAFC